MKKSILIFITVCFCILLYPGKINAEVINTDIVNYAAQFNGYPYEQYTHGPDSFDCSGFVYYVFHHFGIELSVSSDTYWNTPENIGAVVSESEAIPGDIISWEGHVAIYTGNGNCINALNPKEGVLYSSVSSIGYNAPHKYIHVYGVTTSIPGVLDVNFTVDGVNKTNIKDLGIGTIEVYVDGSLWSYNGSNSYGDFARTDIPVGRPYEVRVKITNSNYWCTGTTEGSLTGTTSENTTVRLNISSQGYDRILPDGDYLIVSAGSSDKAAFCFLDIPGTDSPAADGTSVSIYGPYNGNISASEAWTIHYDNGFYTIKQLGTNKCLDVAASSYHSGGDVIVWSDTDTSNQKWAISYNYRNGFNIQSKCSGLYLDVAGGAINTSGSNVLQSMGNGTDSQSWLFIPYAPVQPLENGRYVILSGVDQSWEIDVPGETGNIEENTKVRLWNDSAKSQYNSFDITRLENGYYSIVHHASGKALEVYGGVSDSFIDLTLHSPNGSLPQQWAIIEDTANDGYTIQVRSSGYAVDLWRADLADGATVRQCFWNGSPAQSWRFVPAEYTISYDANGGTGAPSSQIKYYKTDAVLSDSLPVRTGYRCIGWSASSTTETPEYEPGATYLADNDITLYAVWESTNPDFVLPASLTTIEEEAFTGCPFTYVRLSENTTAIKSRAFADCQNLRHIYIPELTTTIAQDAFDGSPTTMTIHGADGSYAEFYANKNGFMFEVSE